jgi:secondary thiamine-phosphate synthase enzyme
MIWYKDTIEIETQGKGLYDFTSQVAGQIRDWGVKEGICFLFLPHTSASLLISESYDPTARLDMEEYLERLVPEGQAWYRHTLEGPDDSTSHIRAMLTDVNITVPIDGGRLSLGTWQGIYLFEHRSRRQRRTVYLRVMAV